MELIVSYLNKFQTTGAKTAIIASAVCATGLTAYYAFFSGSSSNSKLAPAVTEEEARKILTSIVEKVKSTEPKLVQFAEGIKQQLAMQGQEIDTVQLYKSLCLPHLETAIRDIQQVVLDEYDVDDDEFEEAVTTYLDAGDEQIVELSKILKKVYQRFGGEVPDDEEESQAVTTTSTSQQKSGSLSKSSKKKTISLNDLLQLLQLLSERILATTSEYAEEFVSQYGKQTSMSQSLALTFQGGLVEKTQL
jgi:hypothetical protein